MRRGLPEATRSLQPAADPVNGALVDKAEARIYAYEGRAYFFSSDETLSAFSKDPEPFVRRMKRPE